MTDNHSMTDDTAIQTYRLHVDEAVLEDLRARLSRTRWPDAQTVDDWSQGVPLESAQTLIEYWRTDYDWRTCESLLNGLGQYSTVIDGVEIYFLHIRSPHQGAKPLILTHGWPGSVLEFRDVIAPLTEPELHGGDAADAFDLVIPALPGYGFSGKPQVAGWGVAQIARAWGTLMRRLGYDRWYAQGGDWGAGVAMAAATEKIEGLAGLHLNFVSYMPKDRFNDQTEEGRTALALEAAYNRSEAGYSMQQATRPQTLGYGLADSPAAQALWIYEKLQGWSDCGGNPESVFSRDEMLDNIMLYWLSNSGASSARLYWESFSAYRFSRSDLPIGCSIFPKELLRPPQSWLERIFPNIVHWGVLDRGGHFAAWEQPGLFVDELRTCFRNMD